MEMNLDRIAVAADRQQAVAFEVIQNIIMYFIFIQVIAVNKQLRIKLEFEFFHFRLLLTFFIIAQGKSRRHAYIRMEGSAMKEKNTYTIARRLAESTALLRNSDAYLHYLQLMSRFHHYSFRNTLLIYGQKPDATYVAGYQTWIRDFGRHVRRGEKAIRIFAPCRAKKNENEKEEVCRFRCTSVFDISQTEGRPLTSFISEKIQGVIENEDAFLMALKEIAPVPVILKEDLHVHGAYDPQEGVIYLQTGLAPPFAIRTLIHEIAHAHLHHPGCAERSRRQKEVEAESVAYTVCWHYGLDTSAYSLGYIAGWMEAHDEKMIFTSLAEIVRTSDAVIKALDQLLLPAVADHMITPG